MKGIVFTTLNDVVVNKYGLDTWEVLIKDVNHC
ncbi:TPA: heme NO-binding domain-containing protein [Legionella anisa]|nr:heme NO-binding domain-containing protein [Legionella anisa]MCW8426712.1 heme NO-binding domain-containing protein [Legionella anisa]MCW8448376.1 heme NO-binding domain-containing protein [Legionella anisa]UAK78976.1 heme NO-binding domain-containing protein [Legionella anisa]